MNAKDAVKVARIVRRMVAAAILVAAQSAAAHARSAPLVTADIVDRTAGTTLSVYLKDDQRYVIGTPGHEYAIRIRNNARERVLVVTSVDGVNVVSGETASPEQSGYVIDAGDSVEIAGWRRSLERTSAFYFTDLGDSYAARTGRPVNVGVIGLAVYREKPRIAMAPTFRDKLAAHDAARREREDMPASPLAAPQADVHGQPSEAAAATGKVAPESRSLASKLGTGFGRNETSYAQRIRFERATASPAQTLAIQYDRRENLVAMGVLPSPRYAQRAPDPFPGMRFVPAPY
jgi:hypothetical protein